MAPRKIRTPTAAELSQPVEVRRGFAVVIGISSYRNLPAEESLAFAEKDAENVYSALLNKQAGNMDYGNVRKLIGPDATLANMREALENWLPSQAGPTDRVVVVFVGHGLVGDDGHGYLAPYDVDRNQVPATAYSMDRLSRVLSSDVKSLWKILFVDACHSGKVSVNTFERIRAGLGELPQGFLVLSSSRASEASYEDPELAGGNGVFSYFLVHGWLGEADTDPQDGKVTADELVSYVKSEVRAYVKGRLRGQGAGSAPQQNPQEFGDFPDDLVLGYSPERRERVRSEVTAPSTGTLLIEVNLEGTEVWIDGSLFGKGVPGTKLTVPGLAAGAHVVKGVRRGYFSATVNINLVPGETQTVALKLLQPRPAKPAAQALFDKGQKIWTRSNASPSDLNRAASFFSKAFKEDPSYSSAALALCEVREAQNKPEDGLKLCDNAIQIDNDYIEARHQYGILLMETGDYPEAVRQLQIAATQDPKSSFAHSLLAEALFLANRPKDAEAEADRSLELDSSSAQAFLLRAEAKRIQARFEEAALDYHHALESQEFASGTVRTTIYWLIGTGLVTKHRSGRRSLYRSHKALANFGLCACDLGVENYFRAIRYCTKALAIEADDPSSHLELAEVFARLYNLENRRTYLLKAKEHVETTLKINPDLDIAPDLREKVKEIDGLLAHAQ